MTRCKHGMIPHLCGYCKPFTQKTVSVPLEDKETGERYFIRVKSGVKYYHNDEK